MKRWYLWLGLVLLAVTGVFGIMRYFQDREAHPEWVTQVFLKPNKYSRPMTPLRRVENIVIHYVANPGTSARANRNYFQNLGNPLDPAHGRYASSHYIVGLEGEIIQCIPLREVAYAQGDEYNAKAVSIEVCHPDETGQFSEATIQSLCRLCAWLMDKYGLDETCLLRHYDCTEKLCPKYYVEHPDAWTALKARIAATPLP